MVDREVDRSVWVVLGRSWVLCMRSWAALGIYVGGLGPLLEPQLACVFIVSSFIANPHGREGAGMMSCGLLAGLEVLPALAVPRGLASAASFIRVVIDSSFIANPHGREGAGMMSFGLFVGLEVLPALAVPCGLASAAPVAAWKFFLPSPWRADWLRQPHLFVLCFTVNPLVSEGVCMLSSGLIWDQLG